MLLVLHGGPGEATKYRLTLERLRAAGNARGVAALEAIGPDPARWDLRARNTSMAWAFRTNLPIPNLDRRLGSRFEVPFFLFQGETDVITLTSLATEYFDEVQAPTKGLALIPDAGHFAAFTQPERFLAELRSRVRPLAARPQPLIHSKA